MAKWAQYEGTRFDDIRFLDKCEPPNRDNALEIIECAHELERLGIAPPYSHKGKRGNFSNAGRLDIDGEGNPRVLITPSGIPISNLKAPEDLVLITGFKIEDGKMTISVWSPKRYEPSSEGPLYYDGLMPSISDLSFDAIVHGHDPAVTAATKKILEWYDNVGLTNFAGKYGTPEFSRAVNGVAREGGGKYDSFGVLVPYHIPNGGVFSYATNFEKAFELIKEMHNDVLDIQKL